MILHSKTKYRIIYKVCFLFSDRLCFECLNYVPKIITPFSQLNRNIPLMVPSRMRTRKFSGTSQTYSEPCQTSNAELFAKKDNGFQVLTINAPSLMFDRLLNLTLTISTGLFVTIT